MAIVDDVADGGFDAVSTDDQVGGVGEAGGSGDGGLLEVVRYDFGADVDRDVGLCASGVEEQVEQVCSMYEVVRGSVAGLDVGEGAV